LAIYRHLRFEAQPKNRSIPAVSFCSVECDRQASKFGEFGKDVAQRLFFFFPAGNIPIRKNRQAKMKKDDSP
jgi:hypothetical protein